MRFLAHLVLAGAFVVTPLALAAAASSPDTTTARAVIAPVRGSIALASFRIGVRLATTVRFPAGLGLGLAVCTVGIVLELDDYVRSR